MSHPAQNPALIRAIQAQEAGDLETAVAHYGEVLSADPDCVEALNNLGTIAHGAGQFDAAIDFQLQALSVQPDYMPSQINLARTRARLGDVAGAEAAYRSALARQPDSVMLHSERIQLLYGAGCLDEARAFADAACKHLPQAAELWLVAGNVRLYQRDPAGAEASYRQALEIEDSPRGRANLALALFAQDRFAEAWPLYEARYDPTLSAHDRVNFGNPPWPQWQGEPLSGKRILVIGEQGMGDQLHFARFLPTLAAAGAEVELVCAPALASLLASVPGVRHVHTETPREARFDVWSPLLSLPWRLGLPDARSWPGAPYLATDTARRTVWRDRLQEWAGTRPKLGIAWAGNPGNAIDRMRSLSLDEVLPMVSALKGRAMCFSLQKDASALREVERQCSAGLIPLSDMLGNFADTAALLAELDVVIAVDTATAHLAGALGRPGCVLLSPGADWRWGKTGGETCTLYPSLTPLWRLPGQHWPDVLARLPDALTQLIPAT